jgi:hypothetical protein
MVLVDCQSRKLTAGTPLDFPFPFFFLQIALDLPEAVLQLLDHNQVVTLPV